MNRASKKGSAKRDWKVRPCEDADAQRCRELFQTVYNRPYDFARHEWKFGASPVCLAAPSAWVVDAPEGRLAGHYGATVLPFKLGKTIVNATHDAEALTHPDFRRQGVLTAMIGHAHRRWRRAGIAFALGLPNENWGSRPAATGWVPLFRLQWMVRPLLRGTTLLERLGAGELGRNSIRVLNRARNALRNTPLRVSGRGIKVQVVVQIGPSFDELWNSVEPLYEALVVRDRAWVKYRYANAPGMNYKLLMARRGGTPAGYLAYRLSDAPGEAPVGLIADLFTAPGDAQVAWALLARAVKDLEKGGATAVHALAADGASLHRLLRRAGFQPVHAGFDLYWNPLMPNLEADTLRDPRRFFTTGGDYDVV